jgi:hypothetical protein
MHEVSIGSWVAVMHIIPIPHTYPKGNMLLEHRHVRGSVGASRVLPAEHMEERHISVSVHAGTWQSGIWLSQESHLSTVMLARGAPGFLITCKQNVQTMGHPPVSGECVQGPVKVPVRVHCHGVVIDDHIYRFRVPHKV